MIRRALAILAVLTLTSTAAQAGESDPLQSALWEELSVEYLGDGPVVYNYMVKLIIPRTVEDAFSVPVMVKLSDRIDPIEEVVIIAENNPIQEAARISPRRTIRAVGMNIRLEQSTPVRAAARDVNGVWHVASVRVEVKNPGGCTAAGGGDSADSALGQIAMKQFKRPNRATRLKVGIKHPMHTGLAPDEEGEIIPAYYVDQMTVEDAAGPIADLATTAAIASDPNFFFDLPDSLQSVRVTASDTMGFDFEALETPLDPPDKSI